MKKNVGTIDKVVRILISVAVISLYFTHVLSGTAGIILLVVSGILVITAFTGLCPLYLLLGLNTGKEKK
jgi:hypothetical protein